MTKNEEVRMQKIEELKKKKEVLEQSLEELRLTIRKQEREDRTTYLNSFIGKCFTEMNNNGDNQLYPLIYVKVTGVNDDRLICYAIHEYPDTLSIDPNHYMTAISPIENFQPITNEYFHKKLNTLLERFYLWGE